MRWPRWIPMIAILVAGLVWTFGPALADPLSRHPSNPRYFTDGSGRAIYLTGSATWGAFKDMSPSDPPAAFDYNAYLDFLTAHNHNFIRLWSWDLTRRYSAFDQGQVWHVAPFPWLRTGPGTALDGKPKFDLTQWDQTYFDRLRSRVQAAQARGIYVAVMFFEGWEYNGTPEPWDWDSHPFNVLNNINGVNGDPNGDGFGVESYSLGVAAVTAIQEEYIRRAVDATNDLDNVLYEIANEAGMASVTWQYQMINYTRSYEAGKPKRHPVGMTDPAWGRTENSAVVNSPADWISPGPGTDVTNDAWRFDPPAVPWNKVVLLDTDHTLGFSPDGWPWMVLTRGHNVILMDWVTTQERQPLGFSSSDEALMERLRTQMGQARSYADRMNLAAMVPRDDLASSRFCLAQPGKEYLVYLPGGGSVTVNLSGGASSFSVEWFNPGANSTQSGSPVPSGNQMLTAPFSGSAVLYLRSGPVNDTTAPFPPTGLTVQ